MIFRAGRKERKKRLAAATRNWWVQNSIPASWNAAQRSSPLADPPSDLWVFSSFVLVLRSSPRFRLEAIESRPGHSLHKLRYVPARNISKGYGAMGGHCQLHTKFWSSDCIASDQILSHLVVGNYKSCCKLSFKILGSELSCKSYKRSK